MVYKAYHKKTGNLYAIKIVEVLSKNEIESIKTEIRIMRECKSEFIV